MPKEQFPDIVVPDDKTQVLRMSEYPYLKKLTGHDIITASGTTLLGSDDKAGVAVIMDLANFLMTNKQERKERIKEELPQTESKPESSKPTSMAAGVGTPTKPMVPKNQTSAQIPTVTDSSGGFMDKLFGSGNNIAKFAKETRTLELGLFARKPTISKNVEKIFRSLKEDEIISTIQALKYSEQIGWRIWTPLVYNVVLNYNRFFNAFISLDSLFRDEISAEVFLGRSTKMQMYYARILGRPDTKDIILDNSNTQYTNTHTHTYIQTHTHNKIIKKII